MLSDATVLVDAGQRPAEKQDRCQVFRDAAKKTRRLAGILGLGGKKGRRLRILRNAGMDRGHKYCLAIILRRLANVFPTRFSDMPADPILIGLTGEMA